MSMENKTPLILCIDDDADTLSLLQYLLKHGNYEVMTASEGRRGIQLATANQPDVIVLDVEMPGLNGYEVCLQLQKDPANGIYSRCVRDIKKQRAGQKKGLCSRWS